MKVKDILKIYGKCFLNKRLHTCIRQSKILKNMRKNHGKKLFRMETFLHLFLLSQTKNILELFMKKNTILYQVQFKDDINKIKDNTKKSRSYPVVILINSSSASAAEILAASFRDSYSDATLIGETTYGKGTVQTAYTLSDGTSVKYTTEKWLTPKGKWIDGKGVTPNRVVQLTEEYLINPIPENDLQLQTALDFLEKERNTSDH